MPYAIDQEALESPNMKILDINNPPRKSIAYQAFPKIVYLHPTDKTKEHLYKSVADQTELEDALKEGWRTDQHVPKPAPVSVAGFETAEEKRGPGRPKAS